MANKSGEDNRFGFTSGVLGILAIVLVLLDSISGTILGILAIIFASIQLKKFKTSWAKAGLILGILAVVLAIISIIIIINNPQYLSQTTP